MTCSWLDRTAQPASQGAETSKTRMMLLTVKPLAPVEIAQHEEGLHAVALERDDTLPVPELLKPAVPSLGLAEVLQEPWR